jgi:hypothetical protein
VNGYEYIEEDDVDVFEEDLDEDVEEGLYEEIEDLLDELAAEDEGEAADILERRRRRRRRRRPRGRRRVPSASGRGYYRQRPSRNYVTQAQLQAGLERVARDVRKNASGIKTVNSRLRSLSASHSRDIARVNAAHDRDVAQLKKDIKKAQESALLMSLLTQPTARDLTADAQAGIVGLQEGEQVLVRKGDGLTAMLPVLLLSGGLGGNGSDSNMMLMAMAMSGALG